MGFISRDLEKGKGRMFSSQSPPDQVSSQNGIWKLDRYHIFSTTRIWESDKANFKCTQDAVLRYSEDTELEIWSPSLWVTGQHSVQKAPKGALQASLKRPSN